MKVARRDPNCGYIDRWLWVPKTYMNVEGTKNALTFQFVDQYSENKVRILFLWKETDHHLVVPRAFWNVQSVPYPIIDLRPQYYQQTKIESRVKLDHRFVNGQLTKTGRLVQTKSMHALLNNPGGTLQLSCGTGKTPTALDFIARSKVPALVVLPDTQLMEQWRAEIAKHLVVPGGVGLIQAGVFDWKHDIVLTTYHTISARSDELPEEVRRWFGVIIWDEGHHISAPTFSISAEAFYGTRVTLTATQERDDGYHIISEYHCGKVIFKDLSQELSTHVVFKWTGLELNEVHAGHRVRDKTGELHLSMLAGYFGHWTDRVRMLLDNVQEAVQYGRKVLVLSNSIDEAVNLTALWNAQDWHSGQVTLYTEIPVPTELDVGETIRPCGLDPRQLTRTLKAIEDQTSKLAQTPAGPAYTKLKDRLDQNLLAMRQHEVHKKIELEYGRRQRQYIKDLLTRITTGGLMIHEVKPAVRKQFIDQLPVVFAIAKYGKEGLDSPALDTVLVSMPFSSRGGLQQLMGRPSRVFANKKKPLVVFFEDNIGPMIGMCKKLRTHLNAWPTDEGGPLSFEMVGHPNSRNKSTGSIFG